LQRCVHSALQTKGACQQSFQATPETDSVQNRIQQIAYDAIATVLGPGVMNGVVPWRLQEANILKPGNDCSLLAASAMCTFVDLVGIRAERGEQTDMPAEKFKPPRHEQQQQGHAEQVP
jgi:hypothetical protein